MIFANNFDLTEQALAEIREVDLMFFLTGSRFFGLAKAKSDYDFFTQDNEEARDFLTACDFEEIILSESLASQYQDPLIEGIFKKGNVHIQLVNNVALKRKIQEYLKESGLMSLFHNDKSSTRKLWHLLIKVGL